MLSGFNTNVRHRGVVFHVQTEDSGRDHPHIITHLYYKGTILASRKSEYADRLNSQNLPDLVKEQMEVQHQAMLARLREGGFDALIRDRVGDAFDDSGATAPARMEPSAARPPTSAPDPKAAAPAARAAAPRAPARKPLDQQILDYLVESARKRKRRTP